MNRRMTGRALAGAAAALVLTGGGVAVAAGNGSDNGTTTPDANSAPQPPRPPAGARGFHLRGPDGPGGRGHGGPGRGFGFGGPGEIARAAASYLGLSEEQLREQLGDGRSLADVARAQGKEVDGLVDAIVAATTARLDRAVDDGWLGAKARDEIVRDLRARVTELVNADLPRPPAFRGPDGRAGRAFRDGKPGCPAPPGRAAPRSDRRDRSGEDQGSTQPGSWSGGGEDLVTA